MQQHARVHLGGSGHSFNPHPSRRTGATSLRRNMPRTALPVSILTRPGGRVQLQHVGFTSAGYKEVSILTRPGGRVQPRPRFGSGTLLWFQSSPVPEDGCNVTGRAFPDIAIVSILTRPGGRVQLRKIF